MSKRLGIYPQAPAHRWPLYNGETPSLRSDVWLFIAKGVGMRKVTPSSGQTPTNCVKLLRWRFVHFSAFQR